jgi:hypothetical protein
MRYLAVGLLVVTGMALWPHVFAVIPWGAAALVLWGTEGQL